MKLLESIDIVNLMNGLSYLLKYIIIFNCLTAQHDIYSLEF